MRQNMPVSNRELTVAAHIARFCPRPTGVRAAAFIDFLPESIFNR